MAGIRIQRVLADPSGLPTSTGGRQASSDDFGGQVAEVGYQAGIDLQHQGLRALDQFKRADAILRREEIAADVREKAALVESSYTDDILALRESGEDPATYAERAGAALKNRIAEAQGSLRYANDPVAVREFQTAVRAFALTATKAAKMDGFSRRNALVEAQDDLELEKLTRVASTGPPKAVAEALGKAEAIINRGVASGRYSGEQAGVKSKMVLRGMQLGLVSQDFANPETRQTVVTRLMAGEVPHIGPLDEQQRLARTLQDQLDAREREDVRRAEKIERETEKRLEETRKIAVDELDSRARAGTLGLDELEDKRRDRVAIGDDYRRLHDLVKRAAAAGGRTDDAAYNAMELRLLSREVSGPRARREILALERIDRLAPSGERSAATLLKMVKDDEAVESANAKSGKDITKDPMFDQGLDDIKQALPASSGPFGNFDDTLLTRRRNAIREYHDKARAKGMTPSGLPEEARKIVDRYLKEQPSQILNMSGLESQLRYRDEAHLNRENDAGRVPKDEYVRQEAIFSAIAKRDAAAKKGTGGKK
ncbi:MAG TPA: hypothetical protein VML54_05945 [Candidatus Limnocylindrales bacterium]|nr:hypothetical protein [Candidatus Limnocylindrales bacterium]